MTDPCTVLKGLLTQIGQPGIPAIPPLPVCAHAETCDRCRALLSEHASLISGMPPPIKPCSCDQCQDNLPVFIDFETDYGAVQAIREHPGTWLHLCSCADCAETYHLTRLLLEQSDLAERLAEAVPPPEPVSNSEPDPDHRKV